MVWGKKQDTQVQQAPSSVAGRRGMVLGQTERDSHGPVRTRCRVAPSADGDSTILITWVDSIRLSSDTTRHVHGLPGPN
jgi:hypothetical protein